LERFPCCIRLKASSLAKAEGPLITGVFFETAANEKFDELNVSNFQHLSSRGFGWLHKRLLSKRSGLDETFNFTAPMTAPIKQKSLWNISRGHYW
jgi:hypothetical protein